MNQTKRWQRSLATWRRSPSLRAAIGLLAAAFAVVMVVVGARGIVRNPLGTSDVTAGKAVAGGVTEAPAPGASSAVDPAQAPVSVPAGFVTWSASQTFGSTRYVLGSSPCGTTTCPALLRTHDGGTTWTQVHRFAQADVSAATGEAQPMIQPAGALSGVHFVTATTGYVFGSDLWITRDAGRTFTQVQHPGTSVLDVASVGSQPLALTATECIQGQCSGRLEVARIGGASAANVSAAVAGVSLPDAIAEAHLVVSGNRVVVRTGTERSGGETSTSWRLDGTALTPISTGTGCNGKPLDAVSAAGGGRFVALCDAAVTARTTSYSTVTSADAGATWQLLGVGNVTLPTQGRVDLASADGTHVVATSGGPREAVDGTTRSSKGGAIMVSGNGGQSWKAATLEGGVPTGGYDSLSVRGATFLALTRLDGDLWSSDDNGVHWSRRNVTAR